MQAFQFVFFLQLIQNAVRESHAEDRVGLQVSSDNLDHPVLISFRKREELRGEHVMNMLEKVSQSKESFSLLEDSLTVVVTSVSMPRGGVGRRLPVTMANFDRYLNFHKSPRGILIEPMAEESDGLCALKAVVIGLEFHECQRRNQMGNRWKNFRKLVVNEKPRAGKKSKLFKRSMDLLGGLEIGSGHEEWGLDELRELESRKLWPRYALKIISRDFDNSVIYDGTKQRGLFTDLADVGMCIRPTTTTDLIEAPPPKLNRDRQSSVTSPTPSENLPESDLGEVGPRDGMVEVPADIEDEGSIADEEDFVNRDEPEEDEDPVMNPPTTIHLLHYSNHYIFMRSVGAWYGKKFFCEICNRAMDKLDNHTCTKPCDGCGDRMPCRLMGGDPHRAFIYCKECRRFFSNIGECRFPFFWSTEGPLTEKIFL